MTIEAQAGYRLIEWLVLQPLALQYAQVSSGRSPDCKLIEIRRSPSVAAPLQLARERVTHIVK